MTDETSIDGLAAQIEALSAEMATPTVVDLTTLNAFELSELLNTLREELYALPDDQMAHPTTDEARELHSRRAACLVAMSKKRWNR